MKKRGTSRILIKLKEAHIAKGESVYKVAKNLNMSYNTVKKYVTEDQIVELMPPDVLRLASYYGRDWHDVVWIIEVSQEDQSTGQMITPLAALALN